MSSTRGTKTALIITIAMFMGSGLTIAQVGVGTQTPDASSELEVRSSDKGILIPRLASQDLIASPAEGLLIYNTTEGKFYYYDGTQWQEVNPWSYRQGSNAADEDDLIMSFNNDSNAGIASSTPQSKLSIGANVSIGATYSDNNAAPVNGLIVEGNVGIGTATPGANALAVNGSVDIQQNLTVTGTVDGIGTVPQGGIIMWSGNVTASFEANGAGRVGTQYEGWALCNGNNGTPDLSGRFIVAFDQNGSTTPVNGGNKQFNYGSVGNRGGRDAHQLSTGEMPSHNHNVSTSTAGNHRHAIGTRGLDTGSTRNPDGSNDDQDSFTQFAGNHTHPINQSNRGSNETHENRPAYYVLAFIMRTN